MKVSDLITMLVKYCHPNDEVYIEVPGVRGCDLITVCSTRKASHSDLIASGGRYRRLMLLETEKPIEKISSSWRDEIDN